jgi:protein-disulfide isomerase
MALVPRVISVLALVGAATFACNVASGEASKESARKGGGGAAPASVAATIGGQPITLTELDARAASSLFKVRQQEYEARRQALDELLNERLLEKEAAARGVTKEKLLETEVQAKVSDTTQKEIDEYYEQNKARFQNQTKEQLTPQISAGLRSRKVAEAQAAFMKSLRDKHAVKVLLDPPRVQVTLDDDASRGPAKAPITIVEFSDYQCPYCSRAEETVQKVLDKYGDKVRLVYRDYPLGFHKNAHGAAEAAECAEEQGKFWEMHAAMFKDQAKLAPADLVATAAGLGLDKDRFKGCLDSGKYREEVQKDFQDGASYGVTGTPTFFINGIMLVGARPLESFTEVIEAELSRQAK